MPLVEAAALLIVAASAGAAMVAWRAARQARRAAQANAEELRTLHRSVRRAIHDLNNPLAAAAINAELLCQVCPDDPKARRLADGIQDQIQRAKESVAILSRLGPPPEFLLPSPAPEDADQAR